MWHLLLTCSAVAVYSLILMNTLCYHVCGISSEPSCKGSYSIKMYWKWSMCFAKPLCLSETYTKAYVDSAFWLSEIFFQCNERYMKALVFFQALPMWSPKDERSVRALHVLNSSSSCFRARDCIFLSSASRVWMMMTYSNLLCLWLWSVLMRDGYLLSAFSVVSGIFRKRYRHPSFVRHWFFSVAILIGFHVKGIKQHHRQGFVFEGREPCSISHYLSATIEDDCVTDSVFSFVFRLPCACDFAVSSDGVSFQLFQRACTECFWIPSALDASGKIYSMIGVMHGPEPKM